jgi:hypothetical protein
VKIVKAIAFALLVVLVAFVVASGLIVGLALVLQGHAIQGGVTLGFCIALLFVAAYALIELV